MQPTKGMVGRSNAGHDKGRYYLVLEIDGNRALVADGKLKTLQAPKRKNIIHISATNTLVDVSEYDTNSKIRKLLWQFNYGK